MQSPLVDGGRLKLSIARVDVQQGMIMKKVPFGK